MVMLKAGKIVDKVHKKSASQSLRERCNTLNILSL